MSAAISLPVSAAGALPPRFWHHWTEHEDAVLCVGWGVRSVMVLAAELGRTPNATYRRAQFLDLGLGCPQGCENVTGAAVRVGFSLGTLWKILRWGNVHVRRAMAHPKYPNRNHVVEPSDVDEAVAAWCACETVETAGRRTGYSGCTIARWLYDAQAAGEIELPPRAEKRMWRIPTKTIDSVVAKQMARETWRQASARVGVSVNTLVTWFREAGIERPATGRWLFPNTAHIDRLVAAKRAAGSRAFRDTRMTKEDAAS